MRSHLTRAGGAFHILQVAGLPTLDTLRGVHVPELPLPRPDVEPDAPRGQWHASAPGLRAPTRRVPPRPRVLLIEPDAELRELLAVALREYGLRVSAVGGAAAARVWAAAMGPAAVVVDTDAVSLHQAAAAIQAAAGPLPLVLLTGAREPTISARRGCRVVARLRKPFGLEDLIAAIHLALGGRRPSGRGA